MSPVPNISTLAILISPRKSPQIAKNGWQKSDEKSDRSIRKSDQKVTERVPKTKKVIELLFCLNGGLANGGLRYLSTIVHDCLRLSSFCDESPPQKGASKKPQKCTIVDDCAQIAKSVLKPPFESPHLDFPDFCRPPFAAP